MLSESKRRLEREFLKRRLYAGAIVIAVVAAFAGALWLEGIDARVEKHRVGGIVERIGPVAGLGTQAIQDGLMVDVRLDDGREAHVIALKASNPRVGQHVEITERVHGSGRSNFSWQ